MRTANFIMIEKTKKLESSPYQMGLFRDIQPCGGGHDDPRHSFVIYAQAIIKFGTVTELRVFYTMVTKTFVTSSLLRYYDG